MLKTLIHTTDNNNLYVYNPKSRISLLIHPDFKKAYEGEIDTDSYYFRKYNYLKKHHFFSSSEPVDFGIIDELMIRDNIVQTPQIVFETTDFCNLDCSYCGFGEFYEGFDERNQKNIDLTSAVNLIKYIFGLRLKDNKNKLYISFYGGEPLFNGRFIMQIVDVVDQLKSEKGIYVEYSMTTNATLLNKYIHFLIENNFQLLISLDGNEVNHSYRSFRGNSKNSFQKVIENIDMVKRDYPEFFDKNISFNAVLHDRNSVKAIYEFIFMRYNKIPRIAELSPSDVSCNKEYLYNKMFRSKRKSEAEYLKDELNLLPHEELLQYKELTDFLKYYSINSYITNITDLLPEKKKYVPTNTCLPFWKKIMLTTSNRLTPCEKVSYHKFSMGEVVEDILINIPQIAKRYNGYYDCVKEKCQHCYINKFCGVCLFLMKDNNFDNLNPFTFTCDEFHDSEAFKLRLYNTFTFLEKYPKDFSQIIENVVIL